MWRLIADSSPLPGIAEHALHPFMRIGPAGTFTPLHHDQSDAWLVQRVGSGSRSPARSIISLGNFRWPNTRIWYAPGRYETEPAETSGTLRAEGGP